MFVYSHLNLVADFYAKDADKFFGEFKELFANEHKDDVRTMGTVHLPEHLKENHTATTYRENKYRLTLNKMAFQNLVIFLEASDDEGALLARMMQFMHIVPADRTLIGNESSLSAILERARVDEDLPAEDEGIPGHNPGSANTDPNAPNVLAKLALGPLPFDADMMEDIRNELEDEDKKNPPKPGQDSLMETLEKRIKVEPGDEAPSRDQIQAPPSMSRDVAMEIQRIRENRDRFKIEGRTGGVAPGVSVAMYTFHNTFDK